MAAVNLFKSRHRLKIENAFLRHQLNIALRRAPHRLRLRGRDAAARLPGSCRDLRRTTSAVCPVFVFAPLQWSTQAPRVEQGAPLRRAVQRSGIIVATPILSGLHHRNARRRSASIRTPRSVLPSATKDSWGWRRDSHECLVSQSSQHGHQDSARISRVACVRRTKIDPAPCSHLPQNPAEVSA